MARKIAPDVLDCLLRATGVPAEDLDRAIAQAKGLLAVARAADEVWMLHKFGDDRSKCDPDCPACKYERASARLRRASGNGGAR